MIGSIPWGLIGFILILTSFVTTRASSEDFPHIDTRAIVFTVYSFWAGIILIAYALLANYVRFCLTLVS